MKETALKLFKDLGDAITVCEAQRDYTDEGLNEKDQQFYETILFCLELLALTDFNTEITHNIPEAADFEGDNTEFNPLPASANYLPEFVFNLATKSNRVDLRKLLKAFITSQKEAAKSVGIRAATVSDYLNEKSSFNCDSFEALLNIFINQK